MSLRKAAEMALDTLEYAVRCAAMFECERAAEILRAALAEPDEYTVECNGKKSSVLTAMMNGRTKREAALAEADEPDLSKCPNCGGPADNGHDRCVPPNPYWCVKCETHPLDAITGAAEMRLSEIGKALEQAVARRNGQTILADVVHALACLDRAEAEVERLRTVIEFAPHHPDCASHYAYMAGGICEAGEIKRPRSVQCECNCWKRTARGAS